MNKDILYLTHIREAIRNISNFTEGGKSEFIQSKLIQDAVIRNLEVIGEATKKISKEVRENESDIPWKEMAGLRDVLIHDYFGIDIYIVWNVVINELPGIEEKIDLILESL